MQKSDVLHILQRCVQVANVEADPSDDHVMSPCNSQEIFGSPSSASSNLSLDIRLLSASVADRLSALRDRIRADGRATLPPSRAVMGPPFVPALDFLRRLVLAAGGGGADCRAGDGPVASSAGSKRPRESPR